jgi:hypothetical protein
MRTQFQNPTPGSKVSITFEFNSYVIGHQGPVAQTVTGVVDQATKFTPPNFIRLITDFDSPVPIREIPLSRITNLEYTDGRTAERQTVQSDTRTWIVDGSKGARYTVIQSQNKWTCSCPGFQFRKSCRHIAEIKD